MIFRASSIFSCFSAGESTRSPPSSPLMRIRANACNRTRLSKPILQLLALVCAASAPRDRALLGDQRVRMNG